MIKDYCDYGKLSFISHHTCNFHYPNKLKEKIITLHGSAVPDSDWPINFCFCLWSHDAYVPEWNEASSNTRKLPLGTDNVWGAETYEAHI